MSSKLSVKKSASRPNSPRVGRLKNVGLILASLAAMGNASAYASDFYLNMGLGATLFQQTTQNVITLKIPL